jgi:hypothetical protein
MLKTLLIQHYLKYSEKRTQFEFGSYVFISGTSLTWIKVIKLLPFFPQRTNETHWME